MIGRRKEVERKENERDSKWGSKGSSLLNHLGSCWLTHEAQNFKIIYRKQNISKERTWFIAFLRSGEYRNEVKWLPLSPKGYPKYIWRAWFPKTLRIKTTLWCCSIHSLSHQPFGYKSQEAIQICLEKKEKLLVHITQKKMGTVGNA